MKIIAFVFVLLLGLISEYIYKDVELPNGYKYANVGARNHSISNSRSIIVVDPDIIRYKLIGEVVVGERGRPKIYDDSELMHDFGYFILNTRTNDYVEGLSLSEFENAARDLGLSLQDF